jgi:diaminopimelate epimerase
MARYLVDRGHQPSGIFPINTRAGQKFLKVPDSGDISVNMGQVSQESGTITVDHNGHQWQGYNINVGNPHAVVFVDSLKEVGELSHAPHVLPTSAYPDGVNVEFVEMRPDGELSMRVHERGSGETRSCGTGTCAVALAATIHKKGSLPTTWVIHPPGGRLEVELDPHSNAILTGPAVLLSEHDLSSYLA